MILNFFQACLKLKHTQSYSKTDKSKFDFFKFKFIDKRRKTTDNKDVILSTIQSTSFQAEEIQKITLNNLLNSENISFSINNNEGLYYLKESSHQLIEKIEANFDIMTPINYSAFSQFLQISKISIVMERYGFLEISNIYLSY